VAPVNGNSHLAKLLRQVETLVTNNRRQVMKKLKKYRLKSTRGDLPWAGRHIHFLRIRAFAIEGVDFTEKENAHFNACRVCRLNTIDALRNLARDVDHTIMPKAA
jgi:hypothetical protein